MSKLFNLFLTLSCFSPLYLILEIRNICEIFNLRKEIAVADEEAFVALAQNLKYNIALTIIWGILLIISVLGIMRFRHRFLNAKNKAGKNIEIVSAQNITSEYYFTYFSLFVLSFFMIDPTDIEHLLDIIILCILLGLMTIVYMRNDMYFINPVLNILNYRSYLITYKRPDSLAENSDFVVQKQFKARVFSKDKLDREINKMCFIKVSQYDFSVCSKKK